MDVGDQQSRELVFAALADQVRREILDTWLLTESAAQDLSANAYLRWGGRRSRRI